MGTTFTLAHLSTSTFTLAAYQFGALALKRCSVTSIGIATARASICARSSIGLSPTGGAEIRSHRGHRRSRQHRVATGARRALEWLRSARASRPVTVVPGNHDIYVRMLRDPGAMRWHDYMRSNVEGLLVVDANDAVSFSIRAPLRQYRADRRQFCQFHMPPILAAGRVGHEQRGARRRCSRRARAERGSCVSC